MLRLAALAAPVLLTACATTAGAVAPGQDFALEVGAQATLPDTSTLRYMGIANDSRCPPNVQCIRAGDADVLVDVRPARATGDATRLILNTERATSAVLGAWRVTLVELAPGPAPRATFRIDADGGTP